MRLVRFHMIAVMLILPSVALMAAAMRADTPVIAVPGMPQGSPGMEGSAPVPFDVVTFDSRGNYRVFSTHRP